MRKVSRHQGVAVFVIPGDSGRQTPAGADEDGGTPWR